jgi:mRNA interferase MazF
VKVLKNVHPILVLWLDGNDVVTAVVTSAKPRTQADVPLDDWATSGLYVASTVRLSRLDSLDQSLLLAKIGHVSESDAKHLKEVWDLYIKPQF